jgi:mannan polymerase II complex MNN10 subunit
MLHFSLLVAPPFLPRIMMNTYALRKTVCIVLVTICVLVSLIRVPPHPRLAQRFYSYGSTKCLPAIPTHLMSQSNQKFKICRQYSPFDYATELPRVATVTAQYGEQQQHYQKSFQTHLIHSIIHSTDVHVLCDPIVSDLWNKPAFILHLLMQELLKPEGKRIEWLMWVDRDTLILDQCRPMSSFLPLTDLLSSTEQGRKDKQRQSVSNSTTQLIVTNDENGLNNGVFLLRVGTWGIELFNAILAFRHYKSEVELRWSEQSAMNIIIHEPMFSKNVQFVPKHWFNGNEEGGPEMFVSRKTADGMLEDHVRRGDYLVHFAGLPHKNVLVERWWNMLEELEDVWKLDAVQRNISTAVVAFWEGVEA